MSQELEIIHKIVDKLSNEPNIITDYILPILTVVLSSLLGLGVAILTLRWQERFQIEKAKHDAANRWLLTAEGALQELISIKQCYQQGIGEDPILRLIHVPPIFKVSDKLDLDLSDLCFITPRKDSAEKPNKWSQIPFIRGMFENYNLLLHNWKEISEMNRAFKGQLIKFFPGQAYGELSNKQAFGFSKKILGEGELSARSMLLERTLVLTDDVMIELDDFLKNFPEYAKGLINTKRLKKYAPLMKFVDGDNAIRKERLTPIPRPNFRPYSEFFGAPTEVLDAQLLTGYETLREQA